MGLPVLVGSVMASNATQGMNDPHSYHSKLMVDYYSHVLYKLHGSLVILLKLFMPI
jgi:hypothetical protein